MLLHSRTTLPHGGSSTIVTMRFLATIRIPRKPGPFWCASGHTLAVTARSPRLGGAVRSGLAWGRARTDQTERGHPPYSRPLTAARPSVATEFHWMNQSLNQRTDAIRLPW